MILTLINDPKLLFSLHSSKHPYDNDESDEDNDKVDDDSDQGDGARELQSLILRILRLTLLSYQSSWSFTPRVDYGLQGCIRTADCDADYGLRADYRDETDCGITDCP